MELRTSGDGGGEDKGELQLHQHLHLHQEKSTGRAARNNQPYQIDWARVCIWSSAALLAATRFV